MKSIILVRHAKSSWKYNVSDLERPLKKRGVKDAYLVAHQFNKSNLKIDAIYTSPANRAHSTCKIFLKILSIANLVYSVDDTLYDFDGVHVMDFIKKLPNHYKTVMIFGHNFAFTTIANRFGDKLIDNLPTSGLIKLNFEINYWRDITFGQTELLIMPKALRV